MKCNVRGDTSPYIPASAMKIGQIGKVIDTHHAYGGLIVLRTYTGVVSLSNPRSTWSDNCPLNVVLFPAGTVVELTVE